MASSISKISKAARQSRSSNSQAICLPVSRWERRGLARGPGVVAEPGQHVAEDHARPFLAKGQDGRRQGRHRVQHRPSDLGLEDHQRQDHLHEDAPQHDAQVHTTAVRRDEPGHATEEGEAQEGAEVDHAVRLGGLRSGARQGAARGARG